MNTKKVALSVSALVVLGLAAWTLAYKHAQSAIDSHFRPYTDVDNYSVIVGPVGSDFPEAEAVNDNGDIVGMYLDDKRLHFRGFKISHGIFTTVDGPGGAVSSTTLYGINNRGDMVGIFRDSKREHGFLLSHGVYTIIDPPSSQDTFIGEITINNKDQIVGCYTDAKNKTNSFLWDHGVYTILRNPKAGTQFLAWRINDAGQIIGGSDKPFHGPSWLLLSHGVYRPIVLPGLPATADVNCINSQGVMVGEFKDKKGDWHGYVSRGDVVTVIAPPESKHYTYANAINNHGLIVGIFSDTMGGGHSFVRKP